MTEMSITVENTKKPDSAQNILRTELRQIVRDLMNILRDSEKSETGQSPAGLLQIVEDKLQHSQFHLAVLGQFKRGKSSFINALLNQAVLPTGVVPLTSVITILHWGPQIAIKVIYRNGTDEMVSPDNLHQLVTEHGNPGNRLGVSSVKIEYPSEFLHRGIVLVDTPGVGSVQQANTQETLDYLPRIDAAIFLFSADQPINTEELSFLQTSRSFAPKYFFVLNKIDLLNSEELAESLNYCQQILSEQFQESVSIYPVSALWHLQGHHKSGVPDLQTELEKFLVRDRDKLWLQGNIQRLQRVTNLLSEKNRLDRNAVLSSRQELRAAVERLHTLQNRAEDTKADCRHILSGESQQALQALTEKVEKYRQEQSYKLRREFTKEFQNSKHEPRNPEQHIFQRLAEELEKFRPDLTQEMKQKTTSLLHRFNLQAGELASEVVNIGGTVLGVEIGLHLPEPELNMESNLEYFFEKEVGLIPWGIKDLLRPIPWALKKGIILRHWVDQALMLLDRNCGRIRVDLAERINATRQSYYQAWQQEIERIVGEIRSAVEQGLRLQGDQVALAGWQKEMAHREKVIAHVEQILAEILSQLDELMSENSF